MLNISKELDRIKSMLMQAGSLPVIERDLLLERLREIYMLVSEIPSVIREQDEDSFELERGEVPAPESDAAPGPAVEQQHRDLTIGTGRKKEQPAAKREQEKEKASADKGKVHGPGILAEKYQGEKSFINETLAEKNGKKDVSSRLQSKPISSISGAIGLNDKYKLIRDLFGGNAGFYEQTINKLNGASNFNEAFNYMNTNFDWEMEDESVQFLLDLVRRKFIVNQDG